MSVLGSQFQGMPIEEVVPAAAEVKSVKRSSLLTGRRRVRISPQSSTTVTPGQISQFVISDSVGLLDVNSMVLSYRAGIRTSTGNDACFDDGPSVWRRIQTSINSQLLDDVDNAHRAANMFVYASADKSAYDGPLSFANFWKHNPNLNNANVAANRQGAALAAYRAQMGVTIASVGTTVTRDFAIPLGLLTPALRGTQYWPLFCMGEMVIQLTSASVGEAVWGALATDYTISDLQLEFDVITPSELYSSLLQDLVQKQGEEGLVIPIDSMLVSQGVSLPPAAADSTIVVSRATNNLRQAICAFVPTASMGALTYPDVSTFPKGGCSSVQFRLGANVYPNNPANTDPRIFWMTQMAFGETTNDRGGIINFRTFGTTTSVAGAVSTGSTGNDPFCDTFIFGYGFDNYKGSKLDMDGASVLGQSGSQLIIQVRTDNSAATDALTPTICLVATRYIHLKHGALRIIGA